MADSKTPTTAQYTTQVLTLRGKEVLQMTNYTDTVSVLQSQLQLDSMANSPK